MKRSRHRWGEMFLIGICLLLVAPPSEAVKATSLIFAKTTSTAAPQEEVSNTAAEDGVQTETPGEETNSTSVQDGSPKLSGIPQIDYIHDPNLPRELNGYNLSEYPFYEYVPKPETMDFKCDGLHDGFYASVPHKCQVYHHCLFGIRYDFLCANYTAFDQKTFICHFVSEVDCKNSPNYYNRNEALYKATTPSPPPPPPTTTTTTTPAPPPPLARPRHRPHYRYDYYDDDYYYPARDDYYDDERPSRRRPKPKPQVRPGRKRRPYEDYDDDRYDRRPMRPQNEPPEEEYEERRSYDRPRPGGKRPDRYYSDSRRSYDDDQDERRPYQNRPRERRPFRSREEDIAPEEPKYERRFRDEQRKNNDDESNTRRDVMKARESPKLKDSKDEKRLEVTRSRDESTRTRDDNKREEKPSFRLRDDSRLRDDNRRLRDERPYRNREDTERRQYGKPERPERSRQEDNEDNSNKRNKAESTAPEGTSLVKPSGHSIFSQPRVPPKIKRPVPAIEKDKYEYQTVTTTTAASKALQSDDYYDDYDEEDTSRPSPSAKSSSIQQKPKAESLEREIVRPSRPNSSLNSKRPAPIRRPIEYEDEYYDDPPLKTQKHSSQQSQQKSPLKSSVIDDAQYEDYYEIVSAHKEKRRELSSNPPTTNLEERHPSAPAKDIPTRIKDVRTNVKVVKRPFLPSRGGSPFLPRGLQPVAGKNLSATTTITQRPTTTTVTTTTTTTTTTTSTTTENPITTTQKVTTESKPEITNDDEYEYYDDDIVEYDTKTNQSQVVVPTVKEPESEKLKINKPYQETTTPTEQPELTTILQLNKDEHSKELADKVFRIYKQNYEAIKEKLDTTEGPGNYRTKLEDIFNPHLISGQQNSQTQIEQKPYIKPQPKPEVSKPYTATGRPLFPENISIKQNLADSIENDYDLTLNEALTPTLPNPPRNTPSGFLLQSDRDFGFSRFRNNFNYDSQYSASDALPFRKRPNRITGVSIKTPQSYFLQPSSRLTSGFGHQDDGAQRLSRPAFTQEDGVPRPARTIVYRQVPLGDFVF